MSSAQTPWLPQTPQISASSMSHFRHASGMFVWLLLVSSPWKHPTTLPYLGVGWCLPVSLPVKQSAKLLLEFQRCPFLFFLTPNPRESHSIRQKGFLSSWLWYKFFSTFCPPLHFRNSIYEQNTRRFQRSSHCSSVVMNPTIIHEYSSLIPGLAWWVKDRHFCELLFRSQTQLGSDVAVAVV